MDSIAVKYTIDDYGRKSTFSSFLPGISGIHGIPLWCYYVNRGQCIISFGVEDKDHAIMEFYPAHQAYQNVKRTGFRTFIKKNAHYFEPFQKESKKHAMKVTMNGLELEEVDVENQMQTNVVYTTLPGEKVGALLRKLTVKNISSEIVEIEILDGMPAFIPYGVDMNSLKCMGQTIKAWMQVEGIAEKLPYFRVRVSTEDAASVTEVAGGNFSFACLSDGTRLDPIVDPDIVFSYDTTLSHAVGFIESGVEGLKKGKQVTQNQFPCSFYGTTASLRPQEDIIIYQMIGQVESKNTLNQFMRKEKNGRYFEDKMGEADCLTRELCSGIDTKTSSPAFDAYCKVTYLDNILRGGYPIRLGKDKIFYVYSRKHGDLERDYNYFCTLPEFYSQGNGNFRDVNQNRRCDTFFAPFVGNENIKEFYNLIQLDGYNPLAIEKATYAVEGQESEKLFLDMGWKEPKLLAFIEKPFTPGGLYRKLDDFDLGIDSTETTIFDQIMDIAVKQVNGRFGEGYWCDHWTYNLDLVESYLDIFPEKEEQLLFTKEYTYFVSQVNINKRRKRYTKTEGGIRQYYALDKDSARDTKEKLLRRDFGKGEVIVSCLMEKLILLCATKFATLDAYGMGVEMEGGKPGWYDALNGLPGLLGSSMAETYELERNLKYTIDALNRYTCSVEILRELSDFIEQLSIIAKDEKEALFSEMEVVSFWNKINDAKEAYRETTYEGILGQRKWMDTTYLAAVLKEWYLVVRQGIKKACSMESGICPTYFTFEVTQYEEIQKGIVAQHFKVRKMPLFLEGPVRFLKLDHTMKQKQELYKNVKNSDLFDEKLSMYKVNASLENASYEVGRAKAFTPGWLENESIWLHMEYKYLLELLKSGMYEEFFEDFYKAAVPFLDSNMYGRSIYENSSFLASSKNPNEKYHGKGFVARLSGSTIEFIHMWKIMMFGKSSFKVKDGELMLNFSPTIPDYLIGEKDKLSAQFLSGTKVIYLLNGKRELIPGKYIIKEIKCEDKAGSVYTVMGDSIRGDLARKIRDGKIKEIRIAIY